MKLLFKYLVITKAQFVVVIALGLIIGLTNVFILYTISDSNKTVSVIDTQNVEYFFAALLIYSIAQRCLMNILVKSSEKSLMDIRLDLVRLVLRSSYREMEQISKDRLMASFTKDATIISSCWSTIIGMYTSLVILLSGLAYLAYLTLKGFLLTVSVVIVGVTVYTLMTKRAADHMKKARATENSFLDHVQDLIYGGKELKINSKKRFNFYIHDFEKTVALCKLSNIKAKKKFTDAGLAGVIVYFLLIGFVSFHFDRMLPIDDSIKNIYIVLLVFLFSPLTELIATMPTMTGALVSVRYISELKTYLSNSIEISCKISPSVSFDISSEWKTITLKGVSYLYTSDENGAGYKIGPVNLVIEAGDLIFVTGGNGSGKSTLGKLLTGIYLPTHGTISLDDVVINERNIDNYRQLVSAVFNDNHLFSNLFGHENHALLDIKDILRLLGLENKIDHLEINCSRRLSQGQKKRLALANTFMEDRSILFFDEWASEQDPIFKHHFYTKLLPSLKESGKTVIAITHDEKYFHLANRVIHIEDGNVSDESINV